MWIQRRFPFYRMDPKIQGDFQEWYRRLPRLAGTPEQHRRPTLIAALRPISASHGRIRFGPFTKLNAAGAANVAWAHEQSVTCSRWLCVLCRHGCDVCRYPRDSNKAKCTPICLSRLWLPGYAGLWVPRWSVMRVIANGCNKRITNVQYPLPRQRSRLNMSPHGVNFVSLAQRE